MSKFNNPVIEMKISRNQLEGILEEHLNEKVLRTPHRVIEVVTHKQGDYGVTVMVEPDQPMKPGAQVAKEVKGED